MGFPFTVGGVVYSRADFEGADSARNIPIFLRAIQTSVRTSLRATSVTNQPMTLATRAFTVETGKGFITGMPVTLFALNTGLSLYGYVSSYSGATLTIVIQLSDNTAASNGTSWIISYDAPRLGITGVYAAPGGSGVATEVLLRPVTRTRGVLHPENICDFDGHAADVTQTNLANSVARYVGTCFGSGLLSNNLPASLALHKVTRLELQKLSDIHNHPGIAIMEVSAVGDVVAICLDDYGQTPVAAMNNCLMEQCFYIVSAQSLADTYRLSLGWARNGAATEVQTKVWGTAADNTAYGISASYPSYDGQLGFGAENTNVGGAATYANPTQFNVPSGCWMKFSLQVQSGVVATTIKSMEPTKPFSQTFSFTPSGTTTAEGNLATPFIRLRKMTGTNPVAVLVDYIAYTGIGSLTR